MIKFHYIKNCFNNSSLPKHIKIIPRSRLIKAIPIFIIILVITIACNRQDLWENNYTIPDVRVTSASSADTSISFTWEDPSITEMKAINITCTDDSTSSVIHTASVTEGTETYEITGLATGQKYNVNIKVTDKYGKSSPGANFALTALAGGPSVRFIYTVADLNAVRGGSIEPEYAGWGLTDTYFLMADLNLDVAPYNTDPGWEPLGVSGTPFTGTFEGNNHSISNMTITASASDQGLFGYINGGTVQNLSLTNVSITITGASSFVSTGSLAGNCIGNVTNVTASGSLSNTSSSSQNIGGLVGEFSGNISGCTVAVNVTGINRTGGLAGVVATGSVISNSHSTGTVSGSQFIGGLVGYNQGSITGTLDSQCYSTGAVTGIYNTGGLLGMNDGGSITYCYHSTGLVNGGERTGGLIGYNLNGGVITNCNSTGAVQSTGSNTGGLIGWNTGSLSTCYATGAVSVTATYADFIGGLVGQNTAALNGCWTTNTADITVTLTAMTGTSNIGGLVGFSTGSITGCSSAGDVNATLANTSAPAAISANIGGLVGHAYGTPISISSSSASGPVIASMTQTTSYPDTLRIGGLVGHNNGTTIENNSNASGSVTINSTGSEAEFNYVGGLVGHSTGPITESYTTDTCDVNVEITVLNGNTCIGGLVGYIDGTTGNIETSEASGTVNAVCDATVANTDINLFLGGLVGRLFDSSYAIYISTSSASGDVSAFLTAGSQEDNWYIGGFIGTFHGSYITRSRSTGNITVNPGSTADFLYAGGFAGSKNGGISLCFSTGAVSIGAGATLGSYVGGFIGWNSAAIENSYTISNVSHTGSSNSNAGGFVAYNPGTMSPIRYCYSAGILSFTGVTSPGGFAGMAGASTYIALFYNSTNTSWGDLIATGISTSEMQTSSIFTGWDFATIWTIGSLNNGYPYIRLNPPQ